MSTSLISRSPDLSELKKAGYSLEVRGAYLLVRGIPYVTRNSEIAFADIVTNLDISGTSGEEATLPPNDHTVWWTGEPPHTSAGDSMEEHLSCGKWEQGRDIGEGITVYMRWSRKPREAGQARGYRDYRDYREKVETYVEEVGGQAEGLKPGVLEAARKGGDPVVISSTRFAYMDTNSYRNGTKGIEAQIEKEVVAVIGVGGTGSYLVDVLAKTNVSELHLFDDDVMEIHNGFRVAGAARVGELNGNKLKIDWHAERYRNIRVEGLHLHHLKLCDENLDLLRKCTTAFIAIDDLTVRRAIQRACEAMGILHISVGIGLEVEAPNHDQIGGMVKVETNFKASKVKKHEQEAGKPPRAEKDNVYDSNIQTAELNMLGAAMAITEWKAVRGIYRSDRDNANDSMMYSVSTGEINFDQKGEIDRLSACR